MSRDHQAHAAMPSPFVAALATGNYDGPTQGLALGTGGRVFHFASIAEAPLGDHDLRVFAVSLVAERVAAHLCGQSPWPTNGYLVLPPVLPAALGLAIEACEAHARLFAVVATTNLTQTCAAWWPVTAQVADGPAWSRALATAFLANRLAAAPPVQPRP